MKRFLKVFLPYIGPPVLEEKIFEGVFTIFGRGGHLGHVTQIPRTNFRSPYQRRFHIKFGFDWPSGFGEEDFRALWKTDDGRTPVHEYPISSSIPSAQVSLQKIIIIKKNN